MKPSEVAKSVFLDLIELTSDSDQQVFLDDRCGSDIDLRQEVLELLKHDRAGGDFLVGQAFELAATTAQVLIESQPKEIGPYKLMETIGEGGMGVVYVAQQFEPIRRTVALKLIKPGMDSKQVIARFEAERQALAMMNHPNIARVLDAGTTDAGLPYFVMELVKGVAITEYCHKHKLDINARLELFATVCGAVQHAHQKGIIHRDLKPSNVLVELDDVRAVPKVIDFGVAKAIQQPLVESTIYTGIATMIGTPMYMSPEQAELNSLDVDTRSDVYSLGVILYELITGEPPFDRQAFRNASFDEWRRLIREVDPPKPSARMSTIKNSLDSTQSNRRANATIQSGRIRSELDWVVQKSIEKDRLRRYASASDMAEDVRRYLNNEAVLAHPPSLLYQSSKLIRRHRIAIVFMILMIVGAMATFIGTGWQAVRAIRAESSLAVQLTQTQQALDDAEQARGEQVQLRQQAEQSAAKELEVSNHLRVVTRQAQWARYHADIRLAESELKYQDVSDGLEVLLSHANTAITQEEKPGWEYDYLLGRATRGFRGWKIGRSQLKAISWHPNRLEIATVGLDGVCRIVNANDGQVVREWHLGKTILRSVAWSANGRYLAWGNAASENMLRVFDSETGAVQQLRMFPKEMNASVWSIGWHPSRNRMLIGCMQPHAVPADKSEKMEQNLIFLELNADGQWQETERLSTNAHVERVQFRPESNVWAVCSGAGPVEFIPDKTTNDRPRLIEGKYRGGEWVANSPLFVACASGGEIVVYDYDQQAEVTRFKAHIGSFTAIAASPDGKHVATGGNDGEVKLWSTSTWQLISASQRHRGGITSITWNPNSREFASSGGDGMLLIHSLETVGPDTRVTIDQLDRKFAWTSNNGLRSIRNGSEIVDIDATSGEVMRTSRIPGLESGRILNQNTVYGIFAGAGFIVSVDNPAKRYSIDPPDGDLICSTELGDKSAVISGAVAIPKLFQPDGNRSVLGIPDSITYSYGLDISHSGEQLAVVGSGLKSDDGTVEFSGWLYRMNLTGAPSFERTRVGESRARGQSVAWSPDDCWLAVGNQQGLCGMYDAKSLSEKWTRLLHRGKVNTLAWHPSGTRVASAGTDNHIHIWEPESGDVLLTLEVNDSVNKLAFSPDGNQLAASLAGGDICLWDSTPGVKFRDSKLMLDLQDSYCSSEWIRRGDWSQLRRHRQRISSLALPGSVEHLQSLYETALVAALLEDSDTYQSVCQKIATHLPMDITVENLRIIWALAVAPDGLKDYNTVIRSLIALVAKTSELPNTEPGNLLQSLVVLCGLQLRSGDTVAATKTLRQIEVSSKGIESTVYQIYGQFLKSMLLLKSAQVEDSKAASDAAELSFRSLSDRRDVTWLPKIAVELMRRELASIKSLASGRSQD